eukprot:8315771-Prorocentrum_lima.AAC.1
MTSSLVGSEMCIRDSCSAMAALPPPITSMEDARCGMHDNPYGWDQRTSVPVSYTHLTLPTICSV